MSQVTVGVIGLGMMGNTHLDAYAKNPHAKVIAVADANPDLLHGRTSAKGNLDGLAQNSFDLSTVKKYSEGLDLINDPEIQAVDICLPTFLHKKYALAALAAGKHLLLEKPVARTYADSVEIVEAAKKSGKIAMPAMCMRFWPGWNWLKQAVDSKVYGGVLSATFKRIGAQPGGRFYQNGALCGGAHLDIHIHDTDFVTFLFGMPKAVTSFGYSRLSGEIDHTVSQFHYHHVPVVIAEGGWWKPMGQPFQMQYVVNFEKATAMFDISAKDPLVVYQEGKEPEVVKLSGKLGYDNEIDYFISCVRDGKQPTVVNLQHGADTARLIEAEDRSIASRSTVWL